MRVDDNRSPKGHLEDVTKALQNYVPASNNNSIALGFLYVGQALAAYHQGHHAEALAKILLAKPLFEKQFPYEYWWALQLEAFLMAKAVVVDATTATLLQLSPIFPPPASSVLDMSWQQLYLPEENGFMPLAREKQEIESLQAARHMFFI